MEGSRERKYYLIQQPQRVTLRRTVSLGEPRQQIHVGDHRVILSANPALASTPIILSPQIQQQRTHVAAVRQQFPAYKVMLSPLVSSSQAVFSPALPGSSSTSGGGPPRERHSRPIKVTCRRSLISTPSLCGNCGLTSATEESCSNCKKALSKSTTRLPTVNRSRLNASNGPNMGINTSKFYNGSASTNDFTKYLQQTNNIVTVSQRRKRTNVGQLKTSKITEPDCITISSDEEDIEEEQRPASTPASVTSQTSNKPRTNEGPEKKAKPYEEYKDDLFYSCQSRSSAPSKETSNVLNQSDVVLAKTTLNLAVESVRIGQMKISPKSVLRVSHVDMQMTAHCSHLGTDIILSLPWEGVVNCDLCKDPREPCMYLVLNRSGLPRLRSILNMEKGKYPYYDPGGEDDERYFIFYISESIYSSSQCNFPILLRKIGLIRRRLLKPQSFCREISFEESESRQTEAAERSMEDEEKVV